MYFMDGVFIDARAGSSIVGAVFSPRDLDGIPWGFDGDSKKNWGLSRSHTAPDSARGTAPVLPGYCRDTAGILF